jgi:hypothetical protein
MELQGAKPTEIAAALGTNLQYVYNVRQKARYADAFNNKLDSLDDEVLRLKPKAIAALDNGLTDPDAALGLRASEVWFKLMGYKGYAREPVSESKATAEDIATRLLEAGGGTVTISVAQDKSEEPVALPLPQGQVKSP